MKRKNKIILISIIIVLIIILVLIEVFRVRKKNIETFGGEEQNYMSVWCPSCKSWNIESCYDENDHWEHCNNCGNVFNKSSHNKRIHEYLRNDSAVCYYDEYCTGCNWKKGTPHSHEWLGGGYEDPVTHEWIKNGDGYEMGSEPTCTQSGYLKRECRNCHYEDTSSLSALGHQYSKIEDMHNGTHRLTCSVCGTETIEAHKLIAVNEEQSCVTPEAVGKQCTICNYNTLSVTKNATGHKFGIGTHSY